MVISPWRRKWQPAPVFLPGKSHGQISLMGYSSWGCKKSWTWLDDWRTTINLTQKYWKESVNNKIESGPFRKNAMVSSLLRDSSAVLNGVYAAAAAKSLQSCPTLCDPIDGSPPGSPIPRIRQARTLEWVAISFPIAWKWKLKVKQFSCVLLFATPWTAAHQAPPSMGFSRQEFWSGVPLPSPWLQ